MTPPFAEGSGVLLGVRPQYYSVVINLYVIPNDISSSHSPDILSIISIFFFLSIESENNFNVPVSTCDDKLYDGVFSDEYLSNITFSIFLIIFIVSVFFSGV